MSSLGYAAAARMLDRQLEAIAYMRSELVPSLEASGRGELSKELRSTVLGSRLGQLRKLKRESQDQLREFLTLEIDKSFLELRVGKIDHAAHFSKIDPMITLLEYLPEQKTDFHATEENTKLASLVKRVFSLRS